MSSIKPRNSQFLLLIIWLSASITMAQITTTTQSQPKPNIIMIMADDLGQETLACYGNDRNKTPNLDRMAANGMKFTQGHSTPLCSPSRVQLMTGKYNNRNYWVFGLLDKTQKTFGTYMKEAGYVTGITGKWQLLGNNQQRKKAGGKIGSLPQEVGFDEYCLWQVDEFGSRYKDPTVTTTTGTEERKGQYGPDVFNDFAIHFVRKHKDEAFFLYYPMVLTHGPFQPTPDDPDYPASSPKEPRDPRYYPGMVAYMDKLIGRLLNEVKAQGLAENTLIIFTGDNGSDKPIRSTVGGKEIPGGKGKTTKFGTNVPLIASWPGTIKPGQTNDNLVDLTDFLPTFLDVAGIKPSPNANLDGLSFLKQLRGEKDRVRDWVFCFYHPLINTDFKAVWAHDKTWKLYDDGKFYNTTTDPYEQNPLKDSDLSDEGRHAKEKLQDAIKEKMAGERAEEIKFRPGQGKKNG